MARGKPISSAGAVKGAAKEHGMWKSCNRRLVEGQWLTGHKLRRCNSDNAQQLDAQQSQSNLGTCFLFQVNYPYETENCARMINAQNIGISM